MLPSNMQHQYWLTKKSVLRKLGGKEDECIISSDAELDAKLELFKSVNESCVQLQRIIDLYQERLCYLAQEENALGRYLKECGKNEKNASAGQLMLTTGKALAYTGHQHLTIRPTLVRLHHEVETFRARAISDTKLTVSEMEKARTEYRAALSWMKSVSSQLDPDSGFGLEKFRKAQSYVKTSKTKFDRYTLTCLQKVDLLAAARCNMFSHALVPYQNALQVFAKKALETLTIAAAKLQKVETYDFSIVTELVESPKNEGTASKTDEPDEDVDKDKNTFFNAEYTDAIKTADEEQENKENSNHLESVTSLLGDDFSAPHQLESSMINLPQSSLALLDLVLPSSTVNTLSDLLGNSASFMPSSLMLQDNFNLEGLSTKKEEKISKQTNTMKAKNVGKTENQMSWLSLFAELDPLANGVMENNIAGDRA